MIKKITTLLMISALCACTTFASNLKEAADMIARIEGVEIMDVTKDANENIPDKLDVCNLMILSPELAETVMTYLEPLPAELLSGEVNNSEVFLRLWMEPLKNGRGAAICFVNAFNTKEVVLVYAEADMETLKNEINID